MAVTGLIPGRWLEVPAGLSPLRPPHSPLGGSCGRRTTLCSGGVEARLGQAAGRAACAGTVMDRWHGHSWQRQGEEEWLGQQGWATSHPEGWGGRGGLQGAPMSMALCHAADSPRDTARKGGGGRWRPCQGLSAGCGGVCDSLRESKVSQRTGSEHMWRVLLWGRRELVGHVAVGSGES